MTHQHAAPTTDPAAAAADACTGAYDCPGPHIEGCHASTPESQGHARDRFAAEQPTDPAADPAAAEQTTAQPAELWCVHVLGPDDVLACTDRAAAVRNAMHLNLATYPLHIQHAADRHYPVAWAVPAPWPHTAQGHAEDLADRDAEDPRWSGPNPDLLPLAVDVFTRAGDIPTQTRLLELLDDYATAAGQHRTARVRTLEARRSLVTGELDTALAAQEAALAAEQDALHALRAAITAAVPAC